jgi:drug/metabolite transporter (DMT)-like permease
MPVLIAGIAAIWHRTRIAAQAWAGLIVSLLGVAVVAGGGGGHSSLTGDGLVLASLAVSAAMTVAQVDMLRGRDPMAVTAVQFMAAAAGALPVALLTEGAPHLVGSRSLAASAGPLLGVLALSVVGTLVPWVCFAYGQARVPAAVAGSFLNIEPLVGALAGALFFGDQVGLSQVAAGMAILAGVALSTLATVGAGAGSDPEPVPSVAPALSPATAVSGLPVLPRQREELSADYLIFDRWATAA